MFESPLRYLSFAIFTEAGRLAKDAKRSKSGVNLLSSRWTQNVSKERCETRSPSSWRRFKRNKSDVTRSIRVVSAFIISSLSELPCCQYSTPITGVAQGERAGLITPRSLVRTQSPVFIIRRFTESATLSIQQQTLAGVAQRKSA